jgi:hypothetical protein
MLINWRGIQAIQITWFQHLKTKLSEYGTLEQQNVLNVSTQKETTSISVGVQMGIQLLLEIKRI